MEPPTPLGTVNVDFTASRTGDLSSQVTVSYTTLAGTSQPGISYTPQTGTATFASGSATTTIAIPVIGNGPFDNASLGFSVKLTGVVDVVGLPVTLDPTPAPMFAVGQSPFGVAIGDLNGDGLPDLAVANGSSNTISVLLNTTPTGASTSTFAPAQDFATGLTPVAVVIGDINGDGKPDLAVANFEGNSISILLNITSAGATSLAFGPAQNFSTGAGTNPRALALADLNGDGKPDIAVANNTTSNVSVFLNQTATGANNVVFAPRQDFDTDYGAVSVAVGDLNGDGKPDIAVASYSSDTVSVLLNITPTGSTTPVFAPEQDFPVGVAPRWVVLADLNGDGKPDLALANYFSNSVSVLLNTTPPGASTFTFAPEQEFAVGTNPRYLAAADMNGDGKIDLVTANNSSDSISVLLNTTSPGATIPTFAAPEEFATGDTPRAVALGDLDGDGKPDIVTANYGSNSVTVLLNSTVPPTIVSDTPLNAQSVPVSASVGQVLNAVLLATFTDPDPFAPITDFPLDNISIDWGDGIITPATQVTQPGGPGTPFQVYGSHLYTTAGSRTLKVTITDVDGGTATTSQPLSLGKGVPILTISKTGQVYSASLTGASGLPTPTLDGVAPTIVFFLGNRPTGTPLPDPPQNNITYTVLATFPGSANYNSARVVSVITSQVANASVAVFGAGQSGSLSTPDGTVSAIVTQPKDDLALPLIVSLVHYNSDPTIGNNTNVSQVGNQTVVDNDGTGQVQLAAYDLRVINARRGVVLVVRFAIPEGATVPVLFYAVPGIFPTQEKAVPSGMFTIVNGAYQVTFTDSSPVTIFDLTGTVFTITDLSALVQPALTTTMTTTLTTLDNPSASSTPTSNDDLLAELLSSQSTNNGALVGVVSSTQISLLSLQGDGTDSNLPPHLQRQQLQQVVDGILREFEQLLGPQLQLFIEGLLVSMQTGVNQSAPAEPCAASPQEPLVPENVFVPVPKEEAQAPGERREEVVAETVSAVSDTFFRSDETLSSLAVGVMSLLPMTQSFAEKEEDHE